MNRNHSLTLLICGALIAGLAAQWFLSEDLARHSTGRILAVGIQAVAGLVVMGIATRSRKPGNP